MTGIDGKERLSEKARRLSAPAASIIVALLLMMLPLPLAWGIMPNLALLLLILWARIQPQLVPPGVAFLLGLAADAIPGLPFGINATIFPMAVLAVRAGDFYFEGHSLAVDWLFAGVLILAAQLCTFELLRFTGGDPALFPMLSQALVTLLAYPLATLVVARMQAWLIRD